MEAMLLGVMIFEYWPVTILFFAVYAAFFFWLGKRYGGEP